MAFMRLGERWKVAGLAERRGGKDSTEERSALARTVFTRSMGVVTAAAQAHEAPPRAKRVMMEGCDGWSAFKGFKCCDIASG
jgi:hypothetical protein